MRQDYQHLYDRRWRKARRFYLDKHPVCVMCREQGSTVEATVVDHIKPHRGDIALFWDQDNWQPLCKLHHDSTKARQEATGRQSGAKVDGSPIDPDHHWQREGRLDS